MPVEIRHIDHARFARSPAPQASSDLPLIRFETPFERRRRKLRHLGEIVILFCAGAGVASLIDTYILKGL